MRLIIVSIVGNLGSGKTLLLTLLGIAELEEHKAVYSTYHINYVAPDGNKAKYVDIGDLLQWLSEQASQGSFAPHSGILLIDEGYAGMDSRSSTSVANKLTTQFLFQSRKLGLDVYIASQLASSLDKRIRRITDAWILSELQPRQVEESYDGLPPPMVEDFRYTYAAVDGSWGEFYLSHEDALKIFPWYSTMEIVMPPMMTVDRKAAQQAKKDIQQRTIAVRRRHPSEILAPSSELFEPVPRRRGPKLTREDVRAKILLARQGKILTKPMPHRKISRNHKRSKP